MAFGRPLVTGTTEDYGSIATPVPAGSAIIGFGVSIFEVFYSDQRTCHLIDVNTHAVLLTTPMKTSTGSSGTQYFGTQLVDLAAPTVVGLSCDTVFQQVDHFTNLSIMAISFAQ